MIFFIFIFFDLYNNTINVIQIRITLKVINILIIVPTDLRGSVVHDFLVSLAINSFKGVLQSLVRLKLVKGWMACLWFKDILMERWKGRERGQVAE